MKEEEDFRKPSLLDEEANDEEAGLVCRSSYPKEIWRLLLQQSTILWPNVKSRIKNTASCISHKRPANLLFIKSLVLVFFLFSLVSILLFLKVNGPGTRYPSGNNLTAAEVPVKGDSPKSLSVPNLLEAKNSQPFCEAVKNCFDKAIEEFILEPQIVKENARMVLECNGTRKEFVSGKGENGIEVFWVDGQTHYKVEEGNSQVYVARLGRQPLPLNLGSLLDLYQRLASVEGSEELRQCLNKSIEEFPKEPHAVQDNAVLQVLCGGSNVTFRSAAGKNEISVYQDAQGGIAFNVKAKGWDQFARFFVRLRLS